MDKVYDMSSLVLPATLDLRRDAPPRCTVLQVSFWDKYDTDTLVYDALSSADGTVSLYTPKLLNLRPVLQEALEDLAPQISGLPKYTFGRHHDRVQFRLREPARSLPLRIGDKVRELALNSIETERFKGLDIVYTLSKDNDLAWVRDWMTWYRDAHGATGAIIADNGSSTYGSQDLLQAMQAVPGFRAVGVLRAPHAYGPALNECKRHSETEFLQSSLLNLVRDRFLSTARAMLNVDIDELVVGRDGASIFDAVARSPFGFLTFRGHWRHAKTTGPDVRHADHIFRNPSDQPCPTKYAIRPNSFIGRRFLQVHSIANIDRNLFRSRRKFSYLHLRQISTSWKYDRNRDSAASLVHDSATEALLSRYLTPSN